IYFSAVCQDRWLCLLCWAGKFCGPAHFSFGKLLASCIVLLPTTLPQGPPTSHRVSFSAGQVHSVCSVRLVLKCSFSQHC
uniref:Uncharacterized protein n=1 Tax=Loxodonta africana TaxID=9785 RepID=G3UE78_LOXAF